MQNRRSAIGGRSLRAVGRLGSRFALLSLSLGLAFGPSEAFAAELIDVTYTHDANGNQTSRTVNGETTVFTYDVRDLLTQVSDSSGVLASYKYDYQGRLVEKVTPAGTRRYVYDGQHLLLETDENGATMAKYNRGPAGLQSVESGGGVGHYHLDALGSPTQIARPDGSVDSYKQYDAWGQARHQIQGDMPDTYGFTGHRHDAESEGYYAKARYYDPRAGRFLTEDPLLGDAATPPSLHRYLYGYSNPTVLIDPSGRQTKEMHDPNSGALVLQEGEPIPTGYVEIPTSQGRMRLVVPAEDPGLIEQAVDFLAGLNILRTDDSLGALQKSAREADVNRRDTSRVLAGESPMRQAAAAARVVEDSIDVGVAVVEDGLTLEGAVSGTKLGGGLVSLAGRTASNRLKRELAREVGDEVDIFLSSERAGIKIDAFNARSSPGVAQSVLEGIDLSRASRNARFGRALYLAEEGETAILELASHGTQATHVIRYQLDLAQARILDLTNSTTAKAWSYYGGRNYQATQAVAEAARKSGFNVIKYPSLQGPANNYAVLDDLDALLVPAMITPVP